ncbi:putative structural protein [Salmonella phage pertopsoe]|uniref:Putative structural protein n=1 Tax=Salmonella phage pertopsoe TaxID=2713310 RepID=A0A6G8RPB0_9CAUD|nr:putative structural protein [Salmonella phage pertopsoe]QIO03209.1 putative structural protein [Salmonella phage pertopsoe]
MADFLSQYTGQQIDQILGSVDDKVSKNDVIDDFEVSDPLFPPSARLTYELKRSVDTINDTLTNKVIRTDSGEQTINGKKTFNALLVTNGGIQVPTGKSVSIADEPTNSTDGVNLSMLRKHGVSEDTTPPGSGLAGELLTSGYYKFNLDFTRLSAYTGPTLPTSVPVQTNSGARYWTMTAFFDALFADNRFNGYVTTTAYDADMLSLESQINNINTSLNGKVNTSTYNTKMASLDLSISNINTSLGNKVEVSTYNTKMTSLDGSISSLTTGKVDVSTYNAKVTSIDNSLGNAVYRTKTNLSSYTVSASGTTALPDFDLVNLCQILVTAQWGTGNVVDTYRVTITRDGTIKTELLVQKSTSGTVTFTGAVVGGKLRISVVNANTTTACSVDYSIAASF